MVAQRGGAVSHEQGAPVVLGTGPARELSTPWAHHLPRPPYSGGQGIEFVPGKALKVSFTNRCVVHRVSGLPQTVYRHPFPQEQPYPFGGLRGTRDPQI